MRGSPSNAELEIPRVVKHREVSKLLQPIKNSFERVIKQHVSREEFNRIMNKSMSNGSIKTFNQKPFKRREFENRATIEEILRMTHETHGTQVTKKTDETKI